jgi:prepilin-type N-terminal cleavage/methylation domain-containing protein
MGQAAVNPVAPASAGTAGRRQPAVRRAFTLVELLVVIGIFLLLMGMTIGSVVSTPKLDRMLAAEQVISDAIRQSRHTARTSGQPVVLKLKKNERSISGLTRQVLWSGVEDWPLMDDGLGGDVAAPGRTGTGLLVPACFRAPADRLFTTAKLSGGNRLWRGLANPASRAGLLISVAVRPPMAGDDPSQTIVPLVLVGLDEATGAPDFASHEKSSLGLALALSDQNTSVHNVTRTTVAKSWEIVGWFGQDGQGRVEVGSIADPPADQSAIVGHRQNVTIVRKGAVTTNDVIGDAEAGPLVGGRWTEISLLIDGPRMVLYRDGRRVGEKAGLDTVNLPARSGTEAERVYVGHLSLSGSDVLANNCLIDDVRLERLGDALAGTLPAGVKVDRDRRITCHPDGRVEVDATASSTGVDIALSADSGESAKITITSAGSVTSSIKNAP